MLTDDKLSAVYIVSQSARDGALVGTLCGCLLGTVVFLIRRRRFSSLMIGPLLSIVPAATTSALLAMLLAVGIPAFSPTGSYPGFSAVYVATYLTMAIAIAAYFALRRPAQCASKKGLIVRVLLWSLLVGIVFGGIYSFTWERPVTAMLIARRLAIGFVVGGALGAGWRYALESVIRRDSQLAAETRLHTSAVVAESPWD